VGDAVSYSTVMTLTVISPFCAVLMFSTVPTFSTTASGRVVELDKDDAKVVAEML
jgi:hypothetical protein